MPPKVQKVESFSETLKEIKKFANSLQTKLHTVMERIEHPSEQEKVEQGKLRYELEKSRFKFTTTHMDELLYSLIDVDRLWIYDTQFDTKDNYSLTDFVVDNVENFTEKVEEIMQDARNKIEALLPIPAASSRREKFTFYKIKHELRDEENVDKEEENVDKEEEE